MSFVFASGNLRFLINKKYINFIELDIQGLLLLRNNYITHAVMEKIFFKAVMEKNF